MAPTLLLDLAGIDLDAVLFDTQFIERLNPHRGDIRMLDRIVWERRNGVDPNQMLAVKNVRDDEFWVPGHIPGRPLFPGVLMIEAAAQAASILYQRGLEEAGKEQGGFLGFAGVDGVKFRGQVVPGDTFLLLCEEVSFKPRRCICQAQGVVNGNLVFEAKITGMPI